MATPVFAELRMPGLTGPGRLAGLSRASRDGRASARMARAKRTRRDQWPRPASLRSAGPMPGWPASWLIRARGAMIRSRRGLVLTAPLAATAIVAGIVFLAFPGLGEQLFKGSWLHQGAAGTVTRSVTSGGQGGAAPGRARRAGAGSGQHRAGQPAPGLGSSPGGSSHRASPGPNPSGRPSPSGQPSPSGAPSASATASPSPSPSPTPSSTSPPSTGTTLPAGYAWQSVSASSIGTTAGWRLGAPAAWSWHPACRA